MVTYTALTARFTAAWNAVIIAIPKYNHGSILQVPNPAVKTLYIQIDEIPAIEDKGFTGALAKRTTTFSLGIMSISRATLDLYLSEIKRCLITWSITSGYARVRSIPQYKERLKNVVVELLCEEVQTVSGW